MGFFDEMPMYSPHARGKLFQRFTLNRDITVGDDTVKAELNEYKNFKTFKWIVETDVQRTDFQPMPGLITPSEYVTIRTNSTDEIRAGDIVWLKSALWRDGRYFIVTDQTQQFTYVPKMRKSFQILSLKAFI